MKKMLSFLSAAAAALALASCAATPQAQADPAPKAIIQPNYSAPTAPVAKAPVVAEPSVSVESQRIKPFTDGPAQSASERQTLSNDNHYTNSAGEDVHSPAYTSNDAPPPRATAMCMDGTYSFSQSRRGTCSQHGGVAKWLN